LTEGGVFGEAQGDLRGGRNPDFERPDTRVVGGHCGWKSTIGGRTEGPVLDRGLVTRKGMGPLLNTNDLSAQTKEGG